MRDTRSSSRLTKAEREKIVQLRKSGLKQTALAKRFGVSVPLIKAILRAALASQEESVHSEGWE